VPVIPLAEQYSLISEAWPRLRYAVERTRPAMVFADDAERYGAALALDSLASIEKVVSGSKAAGDLRPFSELLNSRAGADVDEAHNAVGPATIAKIMFTSGSTSHPKGVLTTHRMLCVNQAQIACCLPLLKERPPKILDWLPWNHVFGGSHNFNMMLANGGSLYIDNGAPTKKGFSLTLRNVREHAGTLAFNVPIGFANLAAAMREDAELRRAFFRDLDLIFYAGASVAPETWDALAEFARRETGRLPLMVSSWGMTETSPAATLVHEPVGKPGLIGVPMPGVTVKLLPSEDSRYELRVSGPNVMPGYFEDASKTAEAFDEDGFLITGDAVKFAAENNPAAGLRFDGRVAEDFKLATGTWVRAASVRLHALQSMSSIAADLVLTGHDRLELGALIFPDTEVLKSVGALQEAGGALLSSALRSQVRSCLDAIALHATSSSTRIARALVLAEPPSISEGELTAKGSLNNRTILARRQNLVDRLYDDTDPAIVRIGAD
jgi:feruloyl-CoA synthase